MDTLFGKFSKKTKKEPEVPEENGNKVDITFIGSTCIGAKSSFIWRFLEGEAFGSNYQPPHLTFKKTVISKGREVELTLWDTAGQEKFLSLLPMYLRRATGVVLGYDITNRGSFEYVKYFYDVCKRNCPNAVLMLIGNKVDLEEGRQVLRMEGEDLARELNIPLFFESK